jgi:pyruvate,water dikinase
MYCVELSPDVRRTQVGAKAANLGKVISLGINVPKAFVVTPKALDFFLQQTGLRNQVYGLLEGRICARNVRRKIYEELFTSVLTKQIPKVLREEISKLAEELMVSAPAGLAVRSSGIQEDSAKASFAGVYESFLCVSSIEEIWESILKCWCSSWSPQAIDYAKKMGVNLQPDQTEKCFFRQGAYPASSVYARMCDGLRGYDLWPFSKPGMGM